MLAVIFLFLFLGGTLGVPANTRIIGGTPAKPGEVPWIVSVKRYASHICGGSILNSKVVLTAAHCVYGFEDKPKMHGVQYGITSLTQAGNYIMVSEIVRHEGYQSIVTYPNDVALLKLSKEINLSNPSIAVPVKLATSIPSTDMSALLAGWGLTEDGHNSDALLKVDLTLFLDKKCKSLVFGYDPKLHFCAGDLAGAHGQCQGDSGGPLVADDGYQYGIVSFSTKPCAKKPGVFTRIPAYIDWINKHM